MSSSEEEEEEKENRDKETNSYCNQFIREEELFITMKFRQSFLINHLCKIDFKK
jgi:hypothetical protein